MHITLSSAAAFGLTEPDVLVHAPRLLSLALAMVQGDGHVVQGDGHVVQGNTGWPWVLQSTFGSPNVFSNAALSRLASMGGLPRECSRSIGRATVAKYGRPAA